MMASNNRGRRIYQIQFLIAQRAGKMTVFLLKIVDHKNILGKRIASTWKTSVYHLIITENEKGQILIF